MNARSFFVERKFHIFREGIPLQGFILCIFVIFAVLVFAPKVAPNASKMTVDSCLSAWGDIVLDFARKQGDEQEKIKDTIFSAIGQGVDRKRMEFAQREENGKNLVWVMTSPVGEDWTEFFVSGNGFIGPFRKTSVLKDVKFVPGRLVFSSENNGYFFTQGDHEVLTMTSNDSAKTWTQSFEALFQGLPPADIASK